MNGRDEFNDLARAWADLKAAIWHERWDLLTWCVLALLIMEGITIAVTLLF